jgi:hypothetical protein
LPVSQTRQDVATSLKMPAAVSSGFSGQFALQKGASYRIYALEADGSVTPLPSAASNQSDSPVPSTITTPDGVVHPVSLTGPVGHVDGATATQSKIFTVAVPKGTNLSSYEWLELQASSGLGNSDVTVTDSISAGQSHAITWNTLASTGTTVFTRVGSCLQWHGYGTPTLSVIVHGAPNAVSVRLLK